MIVAAGAPIDAQEVLRAGIIGCDTSHVVEFTRLINDPEATGSLARVEVTAAFPGGSADIPASRDRLDQFTARLKSMGVTIVSSLEDLRAQCDVFLLESVDGRVHLDQFRTIACGKPVFIDKPAAASLADLLAIFDVAEQTGTPCFSSSALRYCRQVRDLHDDEQLGEAMGATVTSPYQTEPHHPDLFWYGIHGVESLYALLGPGCRQVHCVEGERDCVVVGLWNDGRCGMYRGLKAGPSGGAAYTFTVLGNREIRHMAGFSGYEPLVSEICTFFTTGKPPVSAEETVELFTFMEAAQLSKGAAGRAVELDQVVQRARHQSAQLQPPASSGNSP